MEHSHSMMHALTIAGVFLCSSAGALCVMLTCESFIRSTQKEFYFSRTVNKLKKTSP